VRILYLHPAAMFGGSSKSLIELYRYLRNAGVDGSVLTPLGSASDAFQSEQLRVIQVKGLTQFDNTRYGYYRRLRWIILLRELRLIPYTLNALYKLRQSQFDAIHVNEITLLPVGVVAKKILKIPLIVHVRSLQRGAHTGLRSRWITSLLTRHADAIIAIDHTVANSLDKGLKVSVVHNGLYVEDYPDTLSASMREKTAVRVGFL
jgi:hypothetical protein